ncbi:caspase family protein [Streptomyces sp. NPDC054835]
MTTQSFASGNRRALLIGTGTYDHPELHALRSPEVDCTRLDALLRDPGIGAFEVQTLIDADRPTLERAIGDLFLTAQADDARPLYLSYPTRRVPSEHLAKTADARVRGRSRERPRTGVGRAAAVGRLVAPPAGQLVREKASP